MNFFLFAIVIRSVASLDASKCPSDGLCVGFPLGAEVEPGEDCFLNNKCHIIITVLPISNSTEMLAANFSVMGNLDVNYWIAVGLSKDEYMGNDSVVECSLQLGVKHSWNVVDLNITNVPYGDSTVGVANVKSNIYIDIDNFRPENRVRSSGTICNWIRPKTTTIVYNAIEHKFDLENDRLYLMIAGGTFNSNQLKNYHGPEHKFVTKEAFNLRQHEERISVRTIAREQFDLRHPSTYESCFHRRDLCYGYSIQSVLCVTEKNCDMFLKITPDLSGQGAHRAQIFTALSGGSSPVTPGEGWVAIGLSSDTIMKDDYTIDCRRQIDGRLAIYTGLNYLKYTGGGSDQGNTEYARWENKDQTILYVNGYLSCSFMLREGMQLAGFNISLKTNFHLMIAQGGIRKDARKIRLKGIKAYHRANKTVTSYAVNLITPGIILGTDIPQLIRIHGILMLNGWLGLLNTAIFISRYYKKTWSKKRCRSNPIWLELHRILALFGCALIATGLLIVFTYAKRWVVNSTHAVIGLVAIVLVFLQSVHPLLFNPIVVSSKSEEKWIFAEGHKIFGYIAYILALIAFYYTGSTVTTLRLPVAFQFSFYGSVIFSVLVNFVASAHPWFSKGNGTRSEDIDEFHDDLAWVEPSEEKDDPGHRFRKRILAFYCTGNLFFACMSSLLIYFSYLLP